MENHDGLPLLRVRARIESWGPALELIKDRKGTDRTYGEIGVVSMTRHELAQQLRERLMEKGFVPSERLAQVDDDGIILSYVRCSECGHLALEGAALDLSIQIASSVTGWLASWSSSCQHRN